MKPEWLGILLALGGLFSICGALLNWDWFFNSRKAQLFVTMFGRNGARVFYALLGLVILVMGLGISFGFIVDNPR